MQTSVDFSLHVKEVLNRNNIQIRSLELIDAALKVKFFSHRKKAVLLIRNKVFEREINALGDRTLDIFDTQLIPYLKKGQTVLVVLPTGGKKRYVMQTKIVNLFVDRFRLTTLDPRDTSRFPFSPPLGVRIRPVCDATVIRIQAGEVRVVRCNDGVAPDPSLEGAALPDASSPDTGFETSVLAGVGAKGAATPDSAVSREAGEKSVVPSAPGARSPQPSIKDILLKEELGEETDDFSRLQGQSPCAGSLFDISYGGMCVSLQKAAAETFFVDQLLAVECDFQKGQHSPAGGDEGLVLFIFAIVRNMKVDQGTIQLNLQFLATLPKAIQRYWQEGKLT